MLPQWAIAHASIAQQFKSTYADDVTDVFTSGQVVRNSDAEPLDGSLVHLGFNNLSVDYTMDGKNLKSVAEEKDLGVITNADFKWEKQCSHVISKVNKVLGMIKRNFVDRSKEMI